MNKNETILFMDKLLKKYHLSQTKLSEQLGISRQYINALVKGRRCLSHDNMITITKLYPMAEYDISSNFVPVSYLDDSKEKLLIDRKLLNKKTLNVNVDSCKIINIVNDSMSPDYTVGDKAIIDISVKQFIDSQIFVFTMNGNVYIRRINIMPNQIKCTATNKDCDTFYLQQGDDYKIVGALVPRIRL